MMIKTAEAMSKYSISAPTLRKVRESGSVHFEVFVTRGNKIGYKYDEEQLKKYLEENRAHRKFTEKVCVFCGKKFIPSYSTQQFCSNACSYEAKKKSPAVCESLKLGQVCQIVQDLGIDYLTWASDREFYFDKWLETHSMSEIKGTPATYWRK